MTGTLHLTQARAIQAAVTRQILETSDNKKSFTERVIGLYHAAVPGHAREVLFLTEGDPYRNQESNRQHLFRLIEGEFENARLPADLVPFLEGALFPEYRRPLQVELCAQRGLLAVPMPSRDPVASICSLSDATIGYAEVMRSLAPVTADGRIDRTDDRVKLLAAREALRSHIAEASGLLALVDEALGTEGAR